MTEKIMIDIPTEGTELEEPILYADIVRDAISALDTSFMAMAEMGMGEELLDEMEGRGFWDFTSQEAMIVALGALGMSTRKIAALVKVNHVKVWRLMQDERAQEAVNLMKMEYSRRIYRWLAGLMPLSVKALLDNLVKGDLDQRKRAADSVLRLLKEGSSSGGGSSEERPRAPQVSPETWKLLEVKDTRERETAEAISEDQLRQQDHQQQHGAGTEEN